WPLVLLRLGMHEHGRFAQRNSISVGWIGFEIQIHVRAALVAARDQTEYLLGDARDARNQDMSGRCAYGRFRHKGCGLRAIRLRYSRSLQTAVGRVEHDLQEPDAGT